MMVAARRLDEAPLVRLAIVVSHPIQHFVPFYRALSQRSEIELTVIYASRIGVEPYFDRDMNTEISWNMDLLGGYDHVFLPEADTITRSGPLTVNNPSVGAALADIRPDAVLIYGYSQLTSLRALWWCRREKVPAMMISDSELRQARSGTRHAVKKMALPIVLKQFSAFLTVGDCNEDYYRHYGVPEQRLFRSPFTIDEALYRGARSDRTQRRTEARARYGIDDGDLVFLTVGKINERKRSADVVAVARRLRGETSPPIRFLLAGNGALMDELSEEIEREKLPVTMAGFVNVDVLPDLYAAADAILHPSSKDPHPLVMSEGACLGLPLLISDRVGAAGPTDIARPGENAMIFPCGDVEAICQAVQMLANDAALRQTMANRSVGIFEELDMERSVQGVVDALAFCLNGTLATEG